MFLLRSVHGDLVIMKHTSRLDDSTGCTQLLSCKDCRGQRDETFARTRKTTNVTLTSRDTLIAQAKAVIALLSWRGWRSVGSTASTLDRTFS
ncbi:hypothetical protein Ae201684P_000934 [Aphanomyces euteiches]|uniref:Uncharacterized protein n=1 Tax=Aphanomyces euteiches TaxID=100861 RepID=A0A6G0XAE3_9STRA|nr:hypothetical protein Ae201684_006771 [Aphanomyces euteiches]KAH9087531.1 hypothetical protein Ae201684P_000934 [Aphanomyces euteiches]